MAEQKTIEDLIRAVEDKGLNLSQDFTDETRNFLRAIEQRFSEDKDIYDEKDREMAALMSYLHNFPSWEELRKWYSSAIVKRLKKRIEKLELSKDLQRQVNVLLDIFEENSPYKGDVTVFPLKTKQLDIRTHTVAHGGKLYEITFMLPDDTEEKFFLKAFAKPEEAQKEFWYQKALKDLGYDVIAPETFSKKSRMITYPLHKGDFVDVLKGMDEEAKLKKLSEVLKKTIPMTVQLTSYDSSRDEWPEDRDLRKAINAVLSNASERDLTSHGIQKRFFTRSQKALGQTAVLENLADKYAKEVLSEIDESIPRQVLHGDLHIGNIILDRDDPNKFYIHDFGGVRGPVFNDLFQLFERARISEEDKYKLVSWTYHIMEDELKKTGKEMWCDKERFKELYNLSRIDMAIATAAMFLEYSKDEHRKEKEIKRFEKSKDQYFSLALKLMRELGKDELADEFEEYAKEILNGAYNVVEVPQILDASGFETLGSMSCVSRFEQHAGEEEELPEEYGSLPGGFPQTEEGFKKMIEQAKKAGIYPQSPWEKEVNKYFKDARKAGQPFKEAFLNLPTHLAILLPPIEKEMLKSMMEEERLKKKLEEGKISASELDYLKLLEEKRKIKLHFPPEKLEEILQQVADDREKKVQEIMMDNDEETLHQETWRRYKAEDRSWELFKEAYIKKCEQEGKNHYFSLPPEETVKESELDLALMKSRMMSYSLLLPPDEGDLLKKLVEDMDEEPLRQIYISTDDTREAVEKKMRERFEKNDDAWLIYKAALLLRARGTGESYDNLPRLEEVVKQEKKSIWKRILRYVDETIDECNPFSPNIKSLKDRIWRAAKLAGVTLIAGTAFALYGIEGIEIKTKEPASEAKQEATEKIRYLESRLKKKEAEDAVKKDKELRSLLKRIIYGNGNPKVFMESALELENSDEYISKEISDLNGYVLKLEELDNRYRVKCEELFVESDGDYKKINREAAKEKLRELSNDYEAFKQKLKERYGYEKPLEELLAACSKYEKFLEKIKSRDVIYDFEIDLITLSETLAKDYRRVILAAKNLEDFMANWAEKPHYFPSDIIPRIPWGKHMRNEQKKEIENLEKKLEDETIKKKLEHELFKLVSQKSRERVNTKLIYGSRAPDKLLEPKPKGYWKEEKHDKHWENEFRDFGEYSRRLHRLGEKVVKVCREIHTESERPDFDRETAKEKLRKLYNDYEAFKQELKQRYGYEVNAIEEFLKAYQRNAKFNKEWKGVEDHEALVDKLIKEDAALEDEYTKHLHAQEVLKKFIEHYAEDILYENSNERLKQVDDLYNRIKKGIDKYHELERLIHEKEANKEGFSSEEERKEYKSKWAELSMEKNIFIESNLRKLKEHKPEDDYKGLAKEQELDKLHKELERAENDATQIFKTYIKRYGDSIPQPEEEKQPEPEKKQETPKNNHRNSGSQNAHFVPKKIRLARRIDLPMSRDYLHRKVI